MMNEKSKVAPTCADRAAESAVVYITQPDTVSAQAAREARFLVYDEIRARNQEQAPEGIEDSVAQAVAAVRVETLG